MASCTVQGRDGLKCSGDATTSETLEFVQFEHFVAQMIISRCHEKKILVVRRSIPSI